jgi:hypothetical protein
MLTAMRWLYHRIGQMFCFAAGPAALSGSGVVFTFGRVQN